MKKSHKMQNDSEYLFYIESGESAAVFIIRDVCKSIDTSGYWIAIIDAPINKTIDKYGKKIRDFKFIDFELFPRTIKPDYKSSISDEEIKYITWLTANKDIEQQRKNGVKGIHYSIVPILYNKNAGKTRKKTGLWNNTFHRFVPEKWKTSSCEYRTVNVPITPNWKYSIKSIKKYPIIQDENKTEKRKKYVS